MRKRVILRGRRHNREELKKIFGLSEKEMRAIDQTVAKMIEDDRREQALEAAAKPVARRRRPAA